jgi:predicted MPP superfamily phosphohydrolase
MWDLVLLAVIVGAVVLLWLMLVDSSRFVVVHYQVSSSAIQKRYRSVVLADLHNKQFGRDNQVLVDAIRKEQPDGIFVAGDMLTAKGSEGYDIARGLMEQLADTYPIYYANGNHEQRMKNNIAKRGKKRHHFEDFETSYQKPLEALGVTFLSNQQIRLGDTGITLVGLEMNHDFYLKRSQSKMNLTYLEECLGKPRSEEYTVLLAHNPEFFPVYAAWGADLVVSGHMHGGMVRVPIWGKGVISPSLHLFPKYDGGEFHQDHTTMLLSRGIGMHTIPIRLFNPGEILVIDFIPQEQSAKE